MGRYNLKFGYRLVTCISHAFDLSSRGIPRRHSGQQEYTRFDPSTLFVAVPKAMVSSRIPVNTAVKSEEWQSDLEFDFWSPIFRASALDGQHCLSTP